MSTKMSNVGECIRLAQAKTGVTSDEICKELGIQRQQLSRWRNASNNKVHTVERLAQMFTMTVDEFLMLAE